MNTSALLPFTQADNRAIVMPYGASEEAARAALDAQGKTWRSYSNRWSRLGLFCDWLDETSRRWYEPDLAAYRDELLSRCTPRSTEAYLSTIRARYRHILKSNSTRDALYDHAGALLAELGQDDTPANRKAMVDELIARLENGVDPELSKVKTKTIQDKVDSQFFRLTKEQASALIASPGIHTLGGLRDTALLAFSLCTGLREQELSDLNVDDLRQTLDGELCVLVRSGKGDKQRAVPYGAGEWALAVVDKWLASARIDRGPVFRSFYKGCRSLRPGRLSTRSIEKIVGRYPVMIGGESENVTPHDLRRTYARRCFDEGMPVVAIQQNLGHADLRTTLNYIGVLDAERRRPPALYTFDLASLNGVEVQLEIESE